MEKECKLNKLASTHLGSSASYAVFSDSVDKTLLVPMPRIEARKDWDIVGDEFYGVDVWHGHEATFLLNNGSPVSGTVKFAYSSRSEFMVESKSMKLYLNTFDMTKMGDTVEESIDNYKKTVKEDLEEILKTEVNVGYHWINYKENSEYPVEDYIAIEDMIDINNVTITDYKAEESHVKTKECEKNNEYKLYTNSLRSRCRHTKQKDTGAAYIKINTMNSTLNIESLFKQIVSLREVDEFHEFCSEKLYMEIMKDPNVTSCAVTLLYSRRGSLDINPSRYTNKSDLMTILNDVNIYTEKVQGQ